MKHLRLSQLKISPIVDAIRNPLYAKAALSRKPGLASGATIPRISSFAYGHRIEEKKCTGLAKITDDDSGTVPLTYPHLIAGDLHLTNMIDDKFPLPIMGTVHVRNAIQWQRRLTPEDVLDMETFIEGHRDTDRGTEFDLQAEVKAGKQVVWTSQSTMLTRSKKKGGQSERKSLPNYEKLQAQETRFEADIKTARAYAAVSGDWNPIHLHDLTAKLLGFRRAIIHGMWTLARSAVALDLPDSGRMEVAFKLPAFLPVKMALWQWTEDGVTHFHVTDEHAAKPYLTGTLEGS